MTTPLPVAPRLSPRRVAGPLIFGGVLAVLAWRAADLLLVGFIAILLALYLSAITDIFIRRLRVPRGVGLLFAFLLTLGIIVGLVALLAPAVGAQFQDLADSVPKYVTAFDRWVRGLAAQYPFLRRTGIAESETGVVTTAISDAVEFVRTSVFAYATVGGRLAIDAAAVLVMAIYLALRPMMYMDGIVAVVPPRYRNAVRPMLDDIVRTLRAWVGAQLLAMVVLGLLTGIGFWLLKVPYFLAFAALTGVAVIVPFFGSIVSTLLPALLVLPERGFLGFLAVASVGVVVHLVEANVVHPLIMHHRVQLPPVLTIFSVLVMGKLAGLLGLFVAVPTLALVTVVVRHTLIYQAYGERPATAAEA